MGNLQYLEKGFPRYLKASNDRIQYNHIFSFQTEDDFTANNPIACIKTALFFS